MVQHLRPLTTANVPSLKQNAWFSRSRPPRWGHKVYAQHRLIMTPGISGGALTL